MIAQLFRLSFLPTRIEAEHAGPAYSKLAWRAADRHVGPRGIDVMAAAHEGGDRRLAVEGATFLGFPTRRNQ